MRTTSTRNTWLLLAIGACTALLAWTGFLDPKKPWTVNVAIACLGVFVIGVPVVVAVATRKSWATQVAEHSDDETNPAWWAFAYLFEVAMFLVVLLSVLSD
ncbi:MAG: hypothetical protein JRE19_19205 [Deltaproteobacteria bacterium]|nr:hypothetical protein [Deltaproteobacteria bacterium]